MGCRPTKRSKRTLHCSYTISSAAAAAATTSLFLADFGTSRLACRQTSAPSHTLVRLRLCAVLALFLKLSNSGAETCSAVQHEPCSSSASSVNHSFSLFFFSFLLYSHTHTQLIYSLKSCAHPSLHVVVHHLLLFFLFSCL